MISPTENIEDYLIRFFKLSLRPYQRSQFNVFHQTTTATINKIIFI